METGSKTVSIHAARVGRDRSDGLTTKQKGRFQSTRPVWAATRRLRVASVPRHSSFNPRGPCGPRPASQLPRCILCVVSIHAARVGRDFAAKAAS